MPQTRVSCPRCRQPVMAEVIQLFDAATDPTAKQKLLSGAFNIIQCPACGFQGNLATPLVYHDPIKELLLTFIPPELGLPREEQERLLGALINRVFTNLPQEQRKAYLFSPQASLTLQSLVERILEADGITREMIQAQQKRLSILQHLLSTSEAKARSEIFNQEAQSIDAEFFALLSRLMETAMASGDKNTVTKLEELHKALLEETEFGKQIKAQTEEIQATIASLQEAKGELTREKLLEIVLKAPSDTRLNVLVSLARPGMDYQFFQLLSERIDRARDTGRQRLITLRETLLDMTQRYDKQLEARTREAHQLLATLLQAKNIQEETARHINVIDDFFFQVLHAELENARKAGDLEQINKLQQILTVIQQATAPSPELVLIEELLNASNDQSQRKLLEEHQEEITPEFIKTLAGLITQVEQDNQQRELVEGLRSLHRQAVRFSMEVNLKRS